MRMAARRAKGSFVSASLQLITPRIRAGRSVVLRRVVLVCSRFFVAAAYGDKSGKSTLVRWQNLKGEKF